MLTDADWCWLVLIDDDDSDWCRLVMIDADWCWLMIINADWWWVMLIDAPELRSFSGHTPVARLIGQFIIDAFDDRLVQIWFKANLYMGQIPQNGNFGQNVSLKKKWILRATKPDHLFSSSIVPAQVCPLHPKTPFVWPCNFFWSSVVHFF